MAVTALISSRRVEPRAPGVCCPTTKTANVTGASCRIDQPRGAGAAGQIRPQCLAGSATAFLCGGVPHAVSQSADLCHSPPRPFRAGGWRCKGCRLHWRRAVDQRIIGAVQNIPPVGLRPALREQDQQQALVMRDGVQQEIAARNIVPGDIVLLEAGRRVPADMRLLDRDRFTLRRVAADRRIGAGEEDGGACARERGRGRGLRRIDGHAWAWTRRGDSDGPCDGGRQDRRATRQTVGFAAAVIIRMERFSKLIAVLVAIAVVILMIVGYYAKWAPSISS